MIMGNVMMYIHCLAHILNLVVQDMSEKVKIYRDFSDTIFELINFDTHSPKCLALFQAFHR